MRLKKFLSSIIQPDLLVLIFYQSVFILPIVVSLLLLGVGIAWLLFIN